MQPFRQQPCCAQQRGSLHPKRQCLQGGSTESLHLSSVFFAYLHLALSESQC